jgi:hypothetical protein
MRHPALFILALGVSVIGSPALAQTTPPAAISRGDITGIAAWQNVNKSNLGGQYHDDWYNRGLYGGGIAGWYWTDHHKTEVEAGASTAARFTVYRGYPAENPAAFATSMFTFSTRRIAISQHYQFFRNAWFHPHVAAGADVNWETTTENAGPVFTYGQTGASREIAPARVIGPDTRVRVRPFGEMGIKAYVAPHGFLRTDLRVLAQRGINEVQVRFGAGIDF